jgi:hypothetical protein
MIGSTFGQGALGGQMGSIAGQLARLLPFSMDPLTAAAYAQQLQALAQSGIGAQGTPQQGQGFGAQGFPQQMQAFGQGGLGANPYVPIQQGANALGGMLH